MRVNEPIKRIRVNHQIRITPVRVIGPDEEQIGVIETSEALKMADELGLDLVEISAEARPPVCKIMEYGKYKFELSKKEQRARAASKSAEMKEVRLGRSAKIDPHDVQIRINQTRKFLLAGHKVQVTQRFRGREIAHKDLGIAHLREVADAVADIAKVESEPRWANRQASIVLAPDRPKVEAVKRKLEKEKAEAEAAKAAKGGKEEGEQPPAAETPVSEPPVSETPTPETPSPVQQEA